MTGEPGAMLHALARSLIDLCRMRKLMLATAESCTGGLIAAALTEVPGSSDVFDRGFVVYSNEAKRVMLAVKAETLSAFGAVSREVALAMAVGALEKAKVDLAVALTGIAGPGGATPGKPVGLVHVAAAARDGRIVHRELRLGAVGRSTVRRRAVVEALKMLCELARGPRPPKPLRKKAPAVGRVRPRASQTPRRSAGKRRQTSRP
jgi:nicotinamide-nucleotide amidase